MKTRCSRTDALVFASTMTVSTVGCSPSHQNPYFKLLLLPGIFTLTLKNELRDFCLYIHIKHLRQKTKIQIYCVLSHKTHCAHDLQGRVRTILALGYLVLGNICRYWVVLLLGDIFFSLWHPIRYQSDSSQHHPHDNHLDICDAAVVSRWGRVGRDKMQAIQYMYIVIIIEFWDSTSYSVVYIIFRFKVNTLLCYTLHSSIGTGIARGQYYWTLDAFFGIVLTLLQGTAKNIPAPT